MQKKTVSVVPISSTFIYQLNCSKLLVLIFNKLAIPEEQACFHIVCGYNNKNIRPVTYRSLFLAFMCMSYMVLTSYFQTNDHLMCDENKQYHQTNKYIPLVQRLQIAENIQNLLPPILKYMYPTKLFLLSKHFNVTMCNSNG